MPDRRSRSRVALAIVALLLAMPLERRNPCAVCPADCPMHAHHRASGHGPGCHHGTLHHDATRPDTGCSMRAGCGHHGTADLAAFHAVLDGGLPPPVAVHARDLRTPASRTRLVFAQAPPTGPPRLLSV